MSYIILALIVYFTLDYYTFKRSEYENASSNSYLKARFNKGLYGEYLTYRKLSKVDGYHKILVNTYVPKSNGETTELDLIFIHEKGIYVIESKNYSGWIFGNENSLNWTQTFKNGKKFKFYNPIKQNKTHIKHLKEYLGEKYPHDYFSVIVFSERCELKKVNYTSDNLKVLNRYHLKRFINKNIDKQYILLTENEVNDLFNDLSIISNVSDMEKKEHIGRINATK